MKLTKLISTLKEIKAGIKQDPDVVIDGTIGLKEVDVETDKRFVNIKSTL